MRFSTALVAAFAGFAAAAIDTIEVKGRHFYTSSGDPFFIKGVDYQPGGAAIFKKGKDPLSDPHTCARDVYLFQQLGINTIRVYSVDPDINHDECMTLLAQAGIYLVLDVNTPLSEEHLNNEEPWTTYTPNYLEHIFKTVEVFSGYANTLAFLAGNEVVFDEVSSKASPNYVKAVVRDLKAYITNHVKRVIPVGYSNADDLKFRNSLAAYLECGDEGYIDFWGVNSYQWCGHNSFEGSGYDKLVEDYKDYSQPIFFTEFGCNESPPRLWEEVDALYSEQMTGVFSGGLVYEYSQEPNNYGVCKIDKGSQAISTLADYTSLQKAYEKAPKAPTIPSSASKPDRPRTCPSEDDSVFDGITANLTLPFTLGKKFIDNGVEATRGKFITPKVTASKYDIKLNGKAVSNPEIEVTFKADNPPLAAGGHGLNTGGGVGSGEPSGSKEAGDDDTSGASANGARGVLSLAVVALGFGLFL